MFADLWRPPVQQVSLCSIRTTDSSRRTRLCMMGTRLKVLRVFKDLHKTRRDVFRDDDRALTVLRPRKSLLLDNVPYSDTPRNKT
ncbi:Complex III assembly factor LYRM7 [Labeo rohita]|uniref:Complex III assembly factor LYRM7 n=1 Tax=Labeo rohita TaxID=84645 RepID=A0ABQ8MB43_LABRO|nr:Complex III assembly factor LYRM7 [Labeo rohita]